MKEIFWGNFQRPSCGQVGCSTRSTDDFLCVLPKEPTLTLKGCKSASFDRTYTVSGGHANFQKGCEAVVEEFQGFSGPTGWHITRDQNQGRAWRLKNPIGDFELRMLDHSSDPLGRKRWIDEGNLCKEGFGSIQLLELNLCNATQFSCSNGKCLDMTKRCDGVEVSYLSFMTFVTMKLIR